MADEGVGLLVAALALIPLFGVALALASMFSDWLSSLARDPRAAETMQPLGLLGFALTEAIALFALIDAFIMVLAA